MNTMTSSFLSVHPKQKLNRKSFHCLQLGRKPREPPLPTIESEPSRPLLQTTRPQPLPCGGRVQPKGTCPVYGGGRGRPAPGSPTQAESHGAPLKVAGLSPGECPCLLSYRLLRDAAAAVLVLLLLREAGSSRLGCPPDARPEVALAHRCPC